MAFRKDLCRNFQRGSCQYGERCKFVHATQQQQQHQNQNPFGFGNSSQQKQNNQFKPFENKWSRTATGPSSRQPDNQPSQQSGNHSCTDPDSCKRQIAEDYQNEKPLWKLTCYGHSKNAPCDIVGDVSFEELRAIAYDEAKRGLTLQSIVERERNLLSSKLIEFESLLRNPYIAPAALSRSQTPFPGATPNAILPSGQNNAPPLLSSFSQLGASLNLASETRPSTPMNNTSGQPNISNFSQALSTVETRPSASSQNIFGQPNGFSNSSQTSSIFGPSPSSTNIFGQPNGFSNSNQTSSIFGKNNSTPPNSGLMSNKLPGLGSRNPFSSNVPGFNNSSVISNQSSPFSSSAVSTQDTHSTTTAQPFVTFDAANATSSAVGDEMQRESVTVDASIWLKEKWTRGEFPEEAPPDEYI
ncbi:zinc finger CCCH domain-containing protein 16 [Mercurialis annua]|uniref:zinc finger CCCH domain-containing protein 16 n=1 Tax=Mercurialis annua TaxID=3986 RepID=UPI00215F67A1|nr:zinc finger CCCH domain-containing protein 16 [Mercurialis annua]